MFVAVYTSKKHWIFSQEVATGTYRWYIVYVVSFTHCFIQWFCRYLSDLQQVVTTSGQVPESFGKSKCLAHCLQKKGIEKKFGDHLREWVTGHFVLEHLWVGWGRSPQWAAAQRGYEREKSERWEGQGGCPSTTFLPSRGVNGKSTIWWPFLLQGICMSHVPSAHLTLSYQCLRAGWVLVCLSGF